MSILARKWSLVSLLTGACVIYTQQPQHSVLGLRQQPKSTCIEKPATLPILLPLPKKPHRSALFSSIFPTAALESSKNVPPPPPLHDKNTQDDEIQGIIEQSKANFLELQDQLVRILLTKVPMVENFQQMTASDLRGALTNLWDTMTMADIIDSVKDVKDTIANPELNQDASVRFGPGLAQEEQNFLRKRLEYQRTAFAAFIGVDPLDVEVEDIPIISVASSGGGYRAMLGLTGYLKAMKDSGALDCVTYIAGISGSCWALSLYYSVLTNCDPDLLIDHLKLHVGTHIGNVSHVLSLAAASTQNATLLLQGLGQRYLQQSSVNLVDLFGTLIGATLYTRTTVPAYNSTDDDDDDPKEEILLSKQDMKLSSQRRFFSDGTQPMPIYCVVRQDLEDKMQDKLDEAHNKATNKELTPEQMKDLVNKTTAAENDVNGDGADDDDYASHLFQWFEFTAYEFGSDEVNAWIPMWSFGRKFADGVNTERLPEQRLDSLLGMFGSAFAASVVHFYQEIRSFLPASSLRMADETIGRYQKSLSVYHPISPAVYPNPFYTSASTPVDDHHLDLYNAKLYSLMDAGMDNNVPFAPLISQRKADIILVVDLSADIQTAPHFDRAEGYVKRRGIDGWPIGAGWPKQDIKETIKNIGEEPTKDVQAIGEQQRRGNQPIDNDNGKAIVDDHGSTSDNQPPSRSNNKERYALGPCTVFPATTSTMPSGDIDGNDDGRRLITLIYFPFIGNDNYDPDFDPQTAEYCSTWNFVYEPDQVEKVVGLAQANWNENTDQVRSVFRAVWERKRRLRLRQRDSENLGNQFMYP